jgi:hypothetical protein
VNHDPGEEKKLSIDPTEAEANLSYAGGPVGYKKPPAKHQFKKGQKPPGSGRKKGGKNLETLFYEIMDGEILITENGKKRRVSFLEACLLKARGRALQGSLLDTIRFFTLFYKILPHLPLREPPILVQMIPGDEGL